MQGDIMEHLIYRGAAILQNSYLVLFRGLRNGGMRDAVLRHHAADKQFVYTKV